MNLDAIKAKLSDDEFKQLSEHVADLTGQRDAARNESINGRKSTKAELETLKAFKAKLLDKLGLSEDSDLESLPDAKGQAEAVKQVEAKMKRLERELSDAQKAKGDVEARFQEARRAAELGKAMGGHAFVDDEIVQHYAGSRMKFEGDELFFEVDDGKLVSVADGINHLAATKPHLLKAKGAGGSGHVPGAGSSAARSANGEMPIDTAAIYAARQPGAAT